MAPNSVKGSGMKSKSQPQRKSQPKPQPQSKQEFLRYNSIGLRIWHWLNFVVILGILGTVLLRETLLKRREIRELFQLKAQESGTPLDPELTKSLAGSLIDRLWDWHINLGYALIALLVLRILVAIVTGDGPVRTLLRHRKTASWHFLLVRAGYATFYAVLVFMALSGLSMLFGEPLHLGKEFVDQLAELHELAQYYFYAFITLHIGGVVIAELGPNKGILSGMIHGNSKHDE